MYPHMYLLLISSLEKKLRKPELSFQAQKQKHARAWSHAVRLEMSLAAGPRQATG